MDKYTGLEIAVIGMAARLPGAGNVNTFWENLKNGVESIRFFSDEELLKEGEEAGTLQDPNYVKAGVLLEDKDFFDAAFFDYRPDEAKLMDPQMRIFHECVWEAIEDAGYNVHDRRNKIGLFAGAASSVNWEVYTQLVNTQKLVDDYSASQLSNARFLATKIAYALDLRGPAIMMDTTCSTSLVTIHQACKSLLLADCTIAVAGGVTISNRGKKGYRWTEGMILSRDGHCRTFDAAASGTIQGEGAGAVVLKTLKNALKDGDNIWAVIRGSGVNNDGDNKVGYTAPSMDGQTEAILTAHKWAKVSPESIGYVEAHGTATRLGDPIEVGALNRAFGKSKEPYCALGSVKSNFGHLDVAAGVAGFIKTVLALKNRQIPPSLHFTNPNPEIDFRDSPFYVNTELTDWKNEKYPLRAGVSSFGIGGTNAHLVLEEAPQREASSESRSHQLLLFSARTPAALERNIGRAENFLREGAGPSSGVGLPDIAYTLQTGRTPFAYRKIFVVRDRADALDQLSGKGPAKEPGFVADKGRPRVIFMFPGQGSQYRNMCYDLYESESTFREEVDKCFLLVKGMSGKDLRSIVFPRDTEKEGQEIDQTEYTQPILFIIEYALARLLKRWGISPDIMIGHSIGEYVAACISGVFSLEDALYLVLKRGELMQRLPGGRMLGISISENELNPLLNLHRNISLATVNSSESCVVAGEEEPLNDFRTVIEEKGYKSGILRTSHAFHSYMVDGILSEFEKEFQRVKFAPLQIPFISNITGKQVTNAEISKPQYWASHLRKTVRFSEGLETVFRTPRALFIEIGPGRTLGTFVRSHRLKKNEHTVVNLVRHRNHTDNDLRYLLSAVGELWLNGIVPDWSGFYEQEVRKKVSLPTYAFERISYPAVADAFKMASGMLAEKPSAKETDISQWCYAPSWKLSPQKRRKELMEKEEYTLIFADDLGVCDTLAEEVKKNAGLVVRVKMGGRFRECAPHLYELDPGQKEGYDRLFADLLRRGQLPARIIHGWSVTDPAGEPEAAFPMAAGFYSVFEMIKACQSAGIAPARQMVVLTSDLHPVLGTEDIPAIKALAPALLTVLSQEHPAVRTSHIDIHCPEMNGRLAEQLYGEILDGEPGKTISLRHGRRWVRIYDKLRPDDTVSDLSFREGGVYLITGGLGDLGFSLAEILLSEEKAKLVLVGRTKPANDGAENEKIKRLRQLEKLGSVLYLDCNTANAAEMTEAIRIAEARFGTINGIIYAAGITAGDSIALISELETPAIEVQFEAKIKGLRVLSDVVKDRELDFCLVTASLSSVLGGIGFGAYAPANAFVDHFIQSGRRKGQLSNWVSMDLDGLDLRPNGANGINKRELFGVFKRVLALRHQPQIVVSTWDLHKRLENWVYREGPSEEEKIDASPGVDAVKADDTGAAGGNAPMVAVQAKLRWLWQNFFGKPEIGLDDDFFELGGDSLKGITMIGRMQKELDVEISIKEFYNRPSIRNLSEYVLSLHKASGKGEAYVAIPQAPASDHYPLSSAQKRLYFLYELDKDSSAYILTRIVKLEGELEKSKLGRVFNALLERHEILRTSFGVINGEPVQKIAEKVELSIDYLVAGADEAESLIKANIHPFDLERAPLLRIVVITTAPKEHLLMVNMHHIITDGVSFGVLIRDFIALYKGQDLPALKLHYKDFAVWQQSAEQRAGKARQREFWLNLFPEIPPMPDLPADFARPAKKGDEGSCIRFTIGGMEMDRLTSIASQEGVSTFMLLLAFLNILLAKLGNQDDIVVGINTAGRQHADLENVLGLFVNTLALRNFPRKELTFREFLAEVKKTTLASFDNQDYQFEELIDYLKIEPDLSRNPLFEVLMVYQNFEAPELVLPGLRIVPYERTVVKTKFDLSLVVFDGGDRLLLTFEYATAVFKRETIERFAFYFKEIIGAAISDMDKKILSYG